MKIYHYTTIETLALILENRTIRFSKLTKVDDPEEYNFLQDGRNPAEYVFVSCWTINEFENIPQWLMYGNKKHGVRIALDEDMFEIKEVNLGDVKGMFVVEGIKQDNLLVMPMLNDNFLYIIRYVENPYSLFDKIFSNGKGEKTICFPEVAKHKRDIWKFQEECRFILIAIPTQINGVDFHPGEVIDANLSSEESYIDISIRQSVFENMEILLGPEVTEAERIIVEALCQKYLGDGRVKESVFRVNR